jgi:hypothetical protein
MDMIVQTAADNRIRQRNLDIHSNYRYYISSPETIFAKPFPPDVPS